MQIQGCRRVCLSEGAGDEWKLQVGMEVRGQKWRHLPFLSMLILYE